MKYVSKSANLLVVLKPGMPAQPVTGTPAQPAVSVRFQDGIVEVDNEEVIKMLEASPSFGVDFIAAETGEDPYARNRRPSEPEHVITELKYGTPVKTTAATSPKQFPPEIQDLINRQAVQMAKEMLPEMVRSTIKELGVEAQQKREEASGPVDEAPKKKPGRPKKEDNPRAVEQAE